MKNKVYYGMTLLFLLLAVVSCKKKTSSQNNTDVKDSDCIKFPDPWISFVEEHRYQYKAPCFNPLNSYEFVYHFKDKVTGLDKLMKYNISTNQNTELVSGVKISGQPKWSKNGWIVFSAYVLSEEQIFIVKDNGDNLTQITTSSVNNNPVWNKAGTKLYWLNSTTSGQPYYYLSRDLSGGNIDTILYSNRVNQGFCSNGTVSNSNKILGYTVVDNKNYIGVADLDNLNLGLSKIFDYDHFFDIQGGPDGLAWHSSGNFFYAVHIGGTGLYKVDLYGIPKLLIRHCDNKKYSKISCSTDGRKIIAERLDCELEYDNQNNPTGKIIHKPTIWIIDTETLIETKIEL